MRYHFELYAITDNLTQAVWTKLYKAVQSYSGVLSKFELTVKCSDNTVRFFLLSDRDLSSLSNNIDGILIRRVNKDETRLPNATHKERFVQFVTGGNILDLKEKYSVSKGKDLEYAVISVRGLGSKTFGQISLLFKNAGGQYSRVDKTTLDFPANVLAINFEDNVRYMKKTLPVYLNIEKSLHMLSSENMNALLQVSTFPYFSHDYFLNLTSYDFDKHSFIVGASGSGKSKFISLFVDRLSTTQMKMNYRVIVIDPHAALAEDFAHIPDHKVITFGTQDGTDLFPEAGADLTAATELTSTLFKSVLADQFNARLDRLLRYSLFVLMTAQTMTLENLKRFITEVEYRNQVIEHVHGYVPQNVSRFFGNDFNELRTQYYETTILPLVSMVDEMQLQPSLVGESEISLARTVQENFLTVFSLNKVSMGDKVVKTIAGLLIQQIFLLAQARAFGQKVILVIDEVSVVQNPAIAQILAEARKFNLTIILAQQYFGQVEKGLRDAIFSNVYNYYAFKVSEEDARALEGNLNIDLPKEVIETEQNKGIDLTDLKVKMMTELDPRECLVRVLSNGQVTPAVKARTVNAPVSKVTSGEPELVKAKQELPEKFVEGEHKKPREIVFSKELTEMIAKSEIKIESPTAQQQMPTRHLGGLRELLAMHSSSRDNVNKKESSP
ncbi:MAG TPA: DUF87 domain-containing protein [Candidatus Saccharimonadales bacterium]|nr:DUF87 domain-containing protein [Candidatus Saccharimonadales bacterium]